AAGFVGSISNFFRSQTQNLNPADSGVQPHFSEIEPPGSRGENLGVFGGGCYDFRYRIYLMKLFFSLSNGRPAHRAKAIAVALAVLTLLAVPALSQEEV